MNYEVDKYRIDHSVGCVYQLNESKDGYLWRCSFEQIGAESTDSEDVILGKLLAWEDRVG